MLLKVSYTDKSKRSTSYLENSTLQSLAMDDDEKREIHELSVALLACRIPGSSDLAQLVFLQRWIQSHIGDADAVLRKPLLITEFGKSSRLSGYSVSKRDAMYRMVYSSIYASASSGGPCRGGLFWQLLTQGMDGFRDGYEIIFSESPVMENMISRHSRRVSSLISTPYIKDVNISFRNNSRGAVSSSR